MPKPGSLTHKNVVQNDLINIDGTHLKKAN